MAIAIKTFNSDAREKDNTRAAEKTAAPASNTGRVSGKSFWGRIRATATITRKNAQKFPSVLAS